MTVGRLALLGALLAGTVVPAQAQGDPMEEQRCVWRCLAESRGASDPAYEACVRARCSGRPARSTPARPAAPTAPPAAAQGWQAMNGIAYPAVGTCHGRSPCLIISCPGPGAMAMELHAAGQAWQPGTVMRLRFGPDVFRAELPARDAPDARWRWPVDAELLDALRGGSEMILDIEGAQYRLSLAGSGRAIGGVEARCR